LHVRRLALHRSRPQPVEHRKRTPQPPPIVQRNHHARPSVEFHERGNGHCTAGRASKGTRRIDDQIDEETFARKQTELRDRVASTKLQIDAVDRSRDETADLAMKVFELSQTLGQQWGAADCATKRRILEIVCLLRKPKTGPPRRRNSRKNPHGPTMRKPFDVLAEGLSVHQSGGKRTPIELFWKAFKAGTGRYGGSLTWRHNPTEIA
jgi:hypothetical protein